MMRRILQIPGNRSCRCRDPTSSCFGISRRLLALQAVQTTAEFSTVSPIVPTRSRYYFEVQGISTRFVSAEAIYVQPTSNDVKMSPSWYHGRANSTNFPKESVAPWELFQAILTLKRASSPKPSLFEPNYVGKWVNGISNHDPKAEAHQDLNKTDESISEIQAKHGENNFDQLKQRLAHELELELRQEIHSTADLDRIRNIFKEERLGAHELLSDKQILRLFYHLLDLDVPFSYEVLKYYVARCKGKGRLVKMDMYLKLIQRIRPLPKEYHMSISSKTNQPIEQQTLQSLVHDITQHIKEEYSDGKAVVYQYLLLPELMSTLMDYKNYSICSMATPIMNYILERELPMLNPELYEYILTKGKRGGNGQDNFPYGRVLSEMVLSGE
jgi:hypothetical protein